MALDLTKPVFRIEFNISEDELIELQKLAATGNTTLYHSAVYTYLEAASDVNRDVIAYINGQVVIDETE